MKLHDMKLHEVTVVGVYRIIRVPGGWIYERQTRQLTSDKNDVEIVFVPYNTEFITPGV